MKKLLLLSAALLLTVSILLSGCAEKKEARKSSSNSTAATTESVEKTTQTKTQKEADKSSSKPKKSSASAQETVGETQEKTETPTSLDYKKILTSKKWNAEKCYENGKEQDIQMYYGSIIKDTGAYLKFNKDGTFKCVMGYIGCKGTYTADSNGKITVTKTVLNTGDNESKINEKEKLKIKGQIDSIRMKLDGIEIVFI